jgi:hypothetical protein
VAERASRRQRVQPRGPGITPAREPAAHEAEPTHPILELQRTVGNQATQRLLMRRGDNGDALYRSRIRRLIVDIHKSVTWRFEHIEDIKEFLRTTGRPEYLPSVPNMEPVRPLVRAMMTNYQATGILTVEMVQMLRHAIGPLRDVYPQNYIDTLLKGLEKCVLLKAEAIEALHSDDPWQWYSDFRKRSPYDVPVDHHPD